MFTVKAAVPDENVPLGEIFRGAMPYWIVLLLVIVAIAVFPQIATFLPNLGNQGRLAARLQMRKPGARERSLHRTGPLRLLQECA